MKRKRIFPVLYPCRAGAPWRRPAAALLLTVALIAPLAAVAPPPRPAPRQTGARSIAYGAVPAEVRAAGGFDPAESTGIFIGVRLFPGDADLAEVPYAVDDAVDMAHLCVFTLDLLKSRRAILCLSGDPQKPESAEKLRRLKESGAEICDANQSTIYQRLISQRKAAGEGGLFIVHAATHGFSDQGVDYLVAASTVRSYIVQTGIRVDHVFEEVSKTKTPRRLVLLDACRERLTKERSQGVSTASPMGIAFAQAVASAAGQVVLTGTVMGGYSFDDNARQNGVFTCAVIEGLSGGAAPDPRGFITAETLSDFVNARVTGWVKENRAELAAQCTGIEKKITGEGSRLPLAISPKAHESYKTFLSRREKAHETLLKHLRKTGPITFEMGGEIDGALEALEDPQAAEPLLRRIEMIETNPAYREDFATYWKMEGRARFSPPKPTPAIEGEKIEISSSVKAATGREIPPTPAASGKSNTEAREAYDQLIAAFGERSLERSKRITYLQDFILDWNGTSAAKDAKKLIEELEALETLALEAKTAFDTLEAREAGLEVLTQAQANARRDAWNDYLKKYEKTEYQTDKARQRRDRWAAWSPYRPTPSPAPTAAVAQAPDLAPGDLVEVSADLKRHVDDFPFLSWMEGMAPLVGQRCEVKETDTDGTVRVYSPDKSSVWWIPTAAVKKVGVASAQPSLNAGDIVQVSSDLRKMVEDSPILLWRDPMAALIGARCEVAETDTDGTVKVFTPDKSSKWWVPVKSVRKVASGSGTGGPASVEGLKAGDRVRLSDDLQRECKESRAGWVDDMAVMVGQECEIKELDTDGTIRVWTPDKSSAWWAPVTSVRRIEFKPGDMVLLSENLKSECESDDAGWVDKMEVMIGRVCEVKRVRDDGRLEIYIPDKSDYWIVPPRAIKRVISGATLKAGDCVRVSANLRGLTQELFPSLWVDSMQNLAGKVCEVEQVDTDGTISVYTPDKSASFWIPEKAATKADCASR